jgi:hypothetical protein
MKRFVFQKFARMKDIVNPATEYVFLKETV